MPLHVLCKALGIACFALHTVEMRSLCKPIGRSEMSPSDVWGRRSNLQTSSSVCPRYLGNRGGHSHGSGVSGVRGVSLRHCPDVFIMIVMLLLRASPLTDSTQVEQQS